MNFFFFFPGELTVNGIPVQSVSPLRDGTLVFLLNDFLFDHRERLVEAFANITGSSSKPEEAEGKAVELSFFYKKLIG